MPDGDERSLGARLGRLVARHGGALGLLALGAILGGLALRASGTNFCLPIEHCHPDEHWLAKPALHMLRTGDLNPHLFVYPALYIYILLGVFSLTFLGGVSAGLFGSPAQAATTPAPFLLAGRLTTAALGTGTLIAIWGAGKRLLDRPSAALAVVALAVMPLHVADSHLVTTDVPAGFFSALALWAAAGVANEGNRKHYRLAGLLAGFAAAAKYNAALVVLNLPLAHLLNPRRERFFSADLLRSLGWVVLGFLIACPYALLDLPHFLDGVATEIQHYQTAHVGHEGQYNRIYYFLFLAGHGFGPVLTGLGIYGVYELLRRRERSALLLLAFPVVYMLFVGSYKVRFVRNLMPAIPYFALWIGYGAARAFAQIRESWPALRRRSATTLAAPALLAAIAWPLWISLDETVAIARPDTRWLARAWIERNVPRGASLYLQSWSVDTLTPGKYRISRESFAWDYYVATDRLSRKYFAMQKVKPEKYLEVQEAFQHRPVQIFEGRAENPYYYTASPTVLIFARDPSRARVRSPAPPAPARR